LLLVVSRYRWCVSELMVIECVLWSIVCVWWRVVFRVCVFYGDVGLCLCVCRVCVWFLWC
jgi:hypothetical protein